MSTYEASPARNRGIACNVFKKWIKSYYLFASLLFYLLYKKGIKGSIFGGLKKSSYEASTALNRGIAWNVFKSLIKSYLFYLLLHCFYYRIKKGIKGDIFGYQIKKSRPMIQLQPETGYPLESLKITNQILSVFLNTSLFFLSYQKWYQR